MSHNDIRDTKLRLVAEDRPAHEGIYYFRLVASHYKEIAEDMREAYDGWAEVRAFVDGLSDDARKDYETMLAVADRCEADLGRLPNTLFHCLARSALAARR